MIRLKGICVSLVALLSLSLLSPSAGYCAEEQQVYPIQESQLQTLVTDLTALQENNEKLRTLLSEQTDSLTMASERSEDLSNQIATLDSQLTQSQEQIATLKAQLVELKQTTATAQASLTTANAELESASKSFKAYQKQQEKIESQLKTQRIIWQIVSGAVLGFAAFK